jgi:predicted metal-binding membrane protein
MMAAMMLPGAIPAVVRRVRAEGRVRPVPLFAVSYLAVWALVGLVVYVAYRPHSSAAAGALTVGAGLYELTPLKRDCRQRCERPECPR